jgi:hypothetical protein
MLDIHLTISQRLRGPTTPLPLPFPFAQNSLNNMTDVKALSDSLCSPNSMKLSDQCLSSASSHTNQVAAYVACWLRSSTVGGRPTGIPCCINCVAGVSPSDRHAHIIDRAKPHHQAMESDQPYISSIRTLWTVPIFPSATRSTHPFIASRSM